jgi:hypothetical protein
MWKSEGEGVNLKEGYNGDLTTRQAGPVGGQMSRDDRELDKSVTPL